MERVNLLLRYHSYGKPAYINLMRSSAEYLGLLGKFDIYGAGQRVDEITGDMYLQNPKLKRSRKQIGTPLKIWLNNNRHRPGPGGLRVIRASSACKSRDLAELATGIDVDWHWMEALEGPVRSRQEWLAVHQAFNP